MKIRQTSGDKENYVQKLTAVLSQNLDFHNEHSGYASHNFHSFPAKFPPQLPYVFIKELTAPGETVLDPMAGSGTTVLEAFLSGRYGVGFDIDPLALLLTKVKTAPLSASRIACIGKKIGVQARQAMEKRQDELWKQLASRWDTKTYEFVNYWFTKEAQLALLALMREIDQLSDEAVKAFFQLAFSAIIITKSGGVSLALDLAHTRPHRAKYVIAEDGHVIAGEELAGDAVKRKPVLTKKLRSPLEEFDKRVQQNLQGLPESNAKQMQLSWEAEADEPRKITPHVVRSDAKQLPLDNSTVDLIVTSPPYAANAIDYMRAHKFSLVWFGYSLGELTEKRKECIGGESVSHLLLAQLPTQTNKVIEEVRSDNDKKGKSLHRYYSEMKQVLQEMYRVLKPGKAAIVVVGNSVLGHHDTQIPSCLSEIGEEIGFCVPKIGVRNLDRNRRMMPAGAKLDLSSQIQQRMHQEYVIGFYKQ
jgi:DNA modification methylase